jgi:hypothetical protein
MPTLFQIAEEIMALHNLLTECGGELSDEEAEQAIDEWLAETKASLENKVDSYCWLIREVEGRADIREQAAKALMAIAVIDDNMAERLKARLKNYLEICGVSKLETPHFKLNIQKSGGSVALIVPPAWEADAASAPEVFHKIKIELNTTAIREAIRNDEETHGARLAERGTHLRIR